ncbi:hypothetical protein BH20CHL7_BH20CHL7_12790 [soil metagenome]
MSISRLWLFLAVALPMLAAVVASISTVDLTYHLRAGSDILATGRIPTVDTWTFTVAGEPWRDQQWGAQVILRLAESVGGWTGLVLLRAAVTAIIVGCLLLAVRRRGLDARTAALLVLVAFVVAAPAMALRPQLLGMACFAVVLLLVADRRRAPRRLWLVPVVVALWANLHGSFFLGPLVVGLAWLEDVHDRVERPHATLLVGVVAAAAASLTPFGPAVWTYAVGLSTDSGVTARVTEWQPTSIRDVAGILFFASVIGVVALIARRPHVVTWPTLAWLGTFFVIGVYALRGVAWWPFAAAVTMAGTLIPVARDPAREEPRTFRRLNVGVVVALLIAGVALLPAWRPTDPGTLAPQGLLSDAPPGITAFLRDDIQPGDRILNEQRWGSWFQFALPEATVAVDSRIELVPAEVWAAHEAILAGVDGWERQLDDWGVTYIVVGPPPTAFASRMEGAGWTAAYQDDDGAVWLRDR